jgi:2-methylcitrate dehydratase PrpD
MRANALRADEIESVVAHVHQGAIDVLGPVVDPQTVHQAKFSMGTVLGLAATRGSASLADFDADWRAPDVVAFRGRVRMLLDDEVDAAYPQRWIGKVELRTPDGRVLETRVEEPKGDPGNTLSPQEVDDKAIRLACYRDGASAEEMRESIARIRALAQTPVVGPLLVAKGR